MLSLAVCSLFLNGRISLCHDKIKIKLIQILNFWCRLEMLHWKIKPYCPRNLLEHVSAIKTQNKFKTILRLNKIKTIGI